MCIFFIVIQAEDMVNIYRENNKRGGERDWDPIRIVVERNSNYELFLKKKLFWFFFFFFLIYFSTGF